VWSHAEIIGFTATPVYFTFLTGSLLSANREVIEVLHPRALAEFYTAFLKSANLLSS
jgi:hypothetical protein